MASRPRSPIAIAITGWWSPSAVPVTAPAVGPTTPTGRASAAVLRCSKNCSNENDGSEDRLHLALERTVKKRIERSTPTLKASLWIYTSDRRVCATILPRLIERNCAAMMHGIRTMSSHQIGCRSNRAGVQGKQLGRQLPIPDVKLGSAKKLERGSNER